MKKEVDSVSVIIPCYNDHEFIEQAVNSAIAQTWANKEIIVIDDGSDNKTKEVLKKIEPAVDLLITQKNSGPSAARNRGIEKASGDYILVLDADDYFEPEFCEKAIRKFKSELQVKMVTSYGQRFKEKPFGQTIIPVGGELKSFLVRNASLGTMFRKQDWLKVRGYDENMKLGLEDWEFYIRLHENGGRTFVIPEILFYYRYKKNSRTQKANFHKHDLLRYIYKKHQDLYKEHFELFIDDIITKLKREEQQQIKLKNQIEFELGDKLLKPLRLIKYWFS